MARQAQFTPQVTIGTCINVYLVDSNLHENLQTKLANILLSVHGVNVVTYHEGTQTITLAVNATELIPTRERVESRVKMFIEKMFLDYCVNSGVKVTFIEDD